MANECFILGNNNLDFIEDEDVQVLVTSLQMSTVAFCFFSYHLTGKQILDELEKKILDISSNITFTRSDQSKFSPPIRFDYHYNTIKLSDLDAILFYYNVVESPEKHFSAVFLYAILIPLTSGDIDKEIMEVVRKIDSVIYDVIRKDVKINNCAISQLYPTQQKDGIYAEGIYFENEELPHMLKEAKKLETPYATLFLHNDYQIPDWYKSMENQTVSSHSFTPPDRNMPTKSAPISTSVHSNQNYKSGFAAMDAYESAQQSGSQQSGFQKFGSQKDGCYIATAVYGSYDCPEVWTLRRFRDYSLAKTIYGRMFIKIYYAISPVLVKLFGNTVWFQRFWKDRLDKMVHGLRKKGYEDTPYCD